MAVPRCDGRPPGDGRDPGQDRGQRGPRGRHLLPHDRPDRARHRHQGSGPPELRRRHRDGHARHVRDARHRRRRIDPFRRQGRDAGDLLQGPRGRAQRPAPGDEGRVDGHPAGPRHRHPQHRVQDRDHRPAGPGLRAAPVRHPAGRGRGRDRGRGTAPRGHPPARRPREHRARRRAPGRGREAGHPRGWRHEALARRGRRAAHVHRAVPGPGRHDAARQGDPVRGPPAVGRRGRALRERLRPPARLARRTS